MKRIILPAILGLMFAACSSEEDVVQNTDQAAGDRYMAINIVTNSTDSRADDYGYLAGDEDEYAVVNSKTTIFYFFDNNGDPYIVTDDDKNYVTGQDVMELKQDASEETAVGQTSATDANVSTTKLMIVLQNKKQSSTPAQVVAIVNKNYDESETTVKLADLKKRITSSFTTTDGKFLMSNSVYKDGVTDVYSTAITTANLATSAELAEKNPVNVYVERVVGKVTVEDTFGSESSPKYYKVEGLDGLAYADANLSMPITYARVKGYKLFNTAPSGYLLKNIEFTADATEVTDASNGVTYATTTAPEWAWSSSSDHRSFWAARSIAVSPVGSTASWSTISETTGKSYPFENISTTNTNVVFAVQLVSLNETVVENNGSTTKTITETPIDIAYWLSKYYTLSGLKTVIAEFLANTLFSLSTSENGNTWTSITPEEIEFETYSNGYQLKPKVTDKNAVNPKKWYANGSTTPYTDDQLATIIERIPKAKIWKDGKCYYYTTINHKYNDGTKDVELPGIIRNHWYQISINSISGLGTPVYDPEQAISPVNPSDTDNEEWYLDASINVLAWRLIKNSIDLQ